MKNDEPMVVPRPDMRKIQALLNKWKWRWRLPARTLSVQLLIS